MASRHDGDLICAAARDGDLNHIASLLSRGVPPDCRESQFGSTPLHWSGQVSSPRGRSRRSAAQAQRKGLQWSANSRRSARQPLWRNAAPLAADARCVAAAAIAPFARGATTAPQRAARRRLRAHALRGLPSCAALR
jgi:hypothetical protein